VIDDRFDELLSAYLDGECSDAERADVEARLQSDEEARVALDELAAARSALRELAWQAPPVGFVERLSAGPSNPRWHAPAAMLGAAAAIVIGFAVASPPHRGPSVVPQLATLAGPATTTAALVSVDGLTSPYRGPKRAGNDFELVAMRRNADAAELAYSNGSDTVTILEQRGHVDWDAMPSGDATKVAGKSARHYELHGNDMWVFERGGVVYTCMGSASRPAMLALAADVSAPAQSRWERAVDVAVGPFGW
jgi:anti-sigma factor RsiW